MGYKISVDLNLCWFFLRKGNIYPSECRVLKNSKERKESLHKWTMQKKQKTNKQKKKTEEKNRMGKSRDIFKNIRDSRGTFHAKMGTIKDRNYMDLTEAKDIN